MKFRKCLAAIVLSLVTVFFTVAGLAQTFVPPIPTIFINGHTYTNANWQANFWGTAAAIANDIGQVTALYPSGRFSPRVILTANLDLYVAPGGNDANNCLVGNPCATVQRPFDELTDHYDLGGFSVTVHLADGSYSPGLALKGRLVGQRDSDDLYLDGNVTTPSAVNITDPNPPGNPLTTGVGTAILARGGAWLTVKGVRLTATFRCVWSDASSEIRIKLVELTNCGAGHVWANKGGRVALDGNITISGPTTRSAFRASQGGILAMSDSNYPSTMPVITLIANPSIPIFLESQTTGILISTASQTTFVGTSVGAKFSVDTLGLINTGGSGINYPPGSTPGVTATGGVYN